MTCRLISNSNIRKIPSHKHRSTPDSRSNSETRSWRRDQENKTVSQAMVTCGQSPQTHRCKRTLKRRRRGLNTAGQEQWDEIFGRQMRRILVTPRVLSRTGAVKCSLATTPSRCGYWTPLSRIAMVCGSTSFLMAFDSSSFFSGA